MFSKGYSCCGTGFILIQFEMRICSAHLTVLLDNYSSITENNVVIEHEISLSSISLIRKYLLTEPIIHICKKFADVCFQTNCLFLYIFPRIFHLLALTSNLL